MNNQKFDNTIFVSYAHEDKSYLDNLRKPLSLLERKHEWAVIWDDTKIYGGEEWHAKINVAISNAKIAILLVSPDFMSSTFILDYELPMILERKNQKKMTILPLLVGEVDLEEIDFSDLQFMNPPEHPIKSMNSAEQDRLYLDVAKRVKTILTIPKPHTGTSPVSEKKMEELRVGTSWRVEIPPELALEEIEHQVRRIVKKTSSQAILVLNREPYYVQFAFYPELDNGTMVMETISNTYLPPDRPLSTVQLKHLSEKLNFKQNEVGGNFSFFAPVSSAEDFADVGRLSWHILDKVFNCDPTSSIVIEGQYI